MCLSVKQRFFSTSSNAGLVQREVGALSRRAAGNSHIPTISCSLGGELRRLLNGRQTIVGQPFVGAAAVVLSASFLFLFFCFLVLAFLLLGGKQRWLSNKGSASPLAESSVPVTSPAFHVPSGFGVFAAAVVSSCSPSSASLSSTHCPFYSSYSTVSFCNTGVVLWGLGVPSRKVVNTYHGPTILRSPGGALDAAGHKGDNRRPTRRPKSSATNHGARHPLLLLLRLL